MLDDIVGVGDNEHLTELARGNRVKLIKERTPAVRILATEHLVEKYEIGLGAALTSERAR